MDATEAIIDFFLVLVLSCLSIALSVVPIIIILLVIAHSIKKAKENDIYFQTTNSGYFSTIFNKGKYGEYLIYKYLKKYEATGAKFLFNLYIPKGNDHTTEIDVLMICEKGIFVFESKNYSGWIFGNENQQYWYQTLPGRYGTCQKERFYNPVLQNNIHIKHLTNILTTTIPIYSIIVFSERCTLKDIQMYSNDIKVTKRNMVDIVISSIYNNVTEIILTETDIANIYDQLYKYSQVDANAKSKHINDISEQHKNNSAEQLHKCPKCNGNLVLRTATRGVHKGEKFYGCSNYPRCSYIQRIDSDINH